VSRWIDPPLRLAVGALWLLVAAYATLFLANWILLEFAPADPDPRLGRTFSALNHGQTVYFIRRDYRLVTFFATWGWLMGFSIPVLAAILGLLGWAAKRFLPESRQELIE
jgi:hypothetical protein